MSRLGVGMPAEVRRLSGRPPRYAAWPEALHPELRRALAEAGAGRPWAHQAETVAHALAGRHTVLATGTASGKSLGYLVPALQAALDGAGDPTRAGLTGRGATALYLAPTKALAADQLARIEALRLPVRAATVDGDTGPEQRLWARRHAHVVLTNLDLLHHSLLPGHEHWRAFLRRLRYVVVDECHGYRGIFGAHVAAVLRRLRRVAQRYGADPVFILASATVADPEVHARALTGLEVVPVTDDGSPRPARSVAFWSADHQESGIDVAEVAGLLLGDLVDRGVSTLAFARSRAGAERVATVARRRLERARPGAGSLVAAYRGGYLPEERRALERRMRAGELRGLAATTALELGIDLTGLDAVVMAGWPGRHAAFWQQAGRAGRAGRESLVVMVPDADPVDRYVATHPDTVLGAPVEGGLVDLDNPHVLRVQVAAAAAEVPLRAHETELFGAATAAATEALRAAGTLRLRPTGWHWVGPPRPTADAPLRGATGVVSIVERSTGALVGTVDESSADAQVHAGAVHVHQGLAWVVTDLDLEHGVASVVRGDPGWRTQARRRRGAHLLEVEEQSPWGPGVLRLGQARVSSQVTGFERRGPAGDLLGEHTLDLPERSVMTRGVWWTLDADGGLATPGALHAAEHALIAALPLVATCDRWDVAGAHFPAHPDTGSPTVLVHDRVAGGAGFAARAYACREEWAAAAYDIVVGCACERGCPSCIQSVTCGSGNRVLDKAGALALLRAIDPRTFDTAPWLSEPVGERR